MIAHSPTSPFIQGYRPVFERLLDDVAFLWLQRSQAENHPAYFRWDLAAMDERIQNYLRALLKSPEISWSLFEGSADVADAGYFFAAAMLAFHFLNTKNIRRLTELAAENRECASGMGAAMACLPGNLVHPWIKKFLISKEKHHQYLALSTCLIRREDPRAYLTALVENVESQSHTELFVCALKLAGVLKRADLLPMLRQAMVDEREEVKFLAAWSCALLRDNSAAPTLQSIAMTNSEWHKEALASLLLLLEIGPARALVDGLARSEDTRHHAIDGCALLGDVRALSWLLQMAREPNFNRQAAHAVISITGITPEDSWLSAESADENHDMEINLDEDLPLIDSDKLSEAWRQNSSRWEPGQRYFLGQPLQVDNLLYLFHQSNQRHRRTAALHLAALVPDRPLLNHARGELFRL